MTNLDRQIPCGNQRCRRCWLRFEPQCFADLGDPEMPPEQKRPGGEGRERAKANGVHMGDRRSSPRTRGVRVPLSDASESAFDNLTRGHALEFDWAASGTRVLLPNGFFPSRARFHPKHGGRRRLWRIPSGYPVKITPDANIGARHAYIPDRQGHRQGFIGHVL
jgi:hypothetical protein